MMTVRFHGRRVLVCVVLLVAGGGVYHLFSLNTLTDVHDRVLLRAIVHRGVYHADNAKPSPAHLACQHPILDVKNPEIYRFFQHIDPVRCGGEPEWVAVRGAVAAITKTARDAHGDVECSFTEVVRDGDDANKRGLTTTTHDTFTLTNTDFYSVSCTAKDGNTWDTIIAGIRYDEDIRAQASSCKIMTELVIPAGKTELELPETRRRMGDKAQFVNAYPFIWNDFKKNGYVTLYAEDQAHIGTFQYRLRGFDKPPTDHYMRPFFISAYPEFKTNPKLCLKATPRHKVFFNYVYDFMNEYKTEPKFAFAFHSELSHDDFNLVSVADQDLLDLLSSLRRDAHLNNTILVVMSDHGHRFSTIRGTQQGKQEERLPVMAIVLPKAFTDTYPSAADNIRMNVHRLTTPFDLFPTMQDVLHFQGARLGQVSDRAISLFSQVPTSRTCADAYIEPHWCACLSWERVSVEDERVQRAALALVHYINTYTAPHRSLCHELTIHKVTWAGKLLPTKGMSYKKNADTDGFVPDLTDETAVSEVVYQVHLHTAPGHAHYEASLAYNIRLDTFSLKIEDVSRTNRYYDQPHCIYNTYEQLRKFCYCREPPPAPPHDKS
nr:uncharacterized protein LOC123767856 [Procambarus clarkii]